MTYVVPQALEFLRHGAGAPLWRLLTSPGNAVAVNAVSAVVVAVCVGFVVRRLVFWYEQFEGPADANADRPLPHAPVSPFLAALRTYLDKQVESGAITPAERKAIGR